jgi:hypothetical protein
MLLLPARNKLTIQRCQKNHKYQLKRQEQWYVLQRTIRENKLLGECRLKNEAAAPEVRMDRNATYRRLLNNEDTPDDAVRLRIIEKDGRPLAEVEWPENSLTNAGDYFYATPIPLALERAHDVKDNYGFSEIVIIIDDLQLWKNAWGTVL